MKTKFKFLLVTCVIAAVAITGFNFAQNGSNIDVSLADIAVMAKADGESGGGNEVNCYSVASISLFYQFYDCGDCCPKWGRPSGTSLKCTYNSANC